MNLIFDLDGTLIDSRIRLFRLFQYLIPESDLGFEDYWKLKKDKISHYEILTKNYNYTEEKWKIFYAKWMIEIEKEKWLKMDKPFVGVHEFLLQLCDENSLYLVTDRQHRESTLKQLHSFGWDNLFKEVMVTEQKVSKEELIKRSISVTNKDFFIGDTGKDIETGKSLGCKTVAVLSGFLGKKALSEYNPDFLFENVLNCKFE